MKKTLGKNIKELRIKKHMSQKRLCDQIGITIRHLLRIEKGEVDPGFSLIVKIAKCLDSPIEALAK